MGMRGGPGRRIVGNPLGGLLRDVDRRTRSTTRRRTGRPPTVAPETSSAPPPRSLVTASTVLTTDGTGRVEWPFPVTFRTPPVLSALPAADRPYLVVVEDVTTTAAVLRLWAVLGLPAGPGLRVHVHATEPGPAGT